MKNRLEIAYELLRDDGVIFIQCDDNEQAYLKVLCDSVFSSTNFVNCIAVKMSEATSVKMAHARVRFPKLKEYLLFYKKNNFSGFYEIDKYRHPVWDDENNIYLENFTKKQREHLKELEEKEVNEDNDIEIAVDILSKVKKTSLKQKIKEMNFNAFEDELNWKFENSYRIIKTAGAANLAKKIKELNKLPRQDISAFLSSDNILFFYVTDFNRTTRDPRFRVIFADSNIYKNPCDFWQDIKTSGAIADEGGVKLSGGKKPEKLLERIIKMTTRKNDIVMDYHLGTGTTCAVAHKMERQYIGIEQLDYGKNDSVLRLKNVIKGDTTGISPLVDWKGGGSFVYLELAKWNESAKEKIFECKSLKELEKLLNELSEKYFLHYNVKFREFSDRIIHEDNFKILPLKKQQEMLCKMLDLNQLYVNASEMEDKKYELSKEDIAITKNFYNL